MKSAKWIVLAAYAKHAGVSANVVIRAIEKGRIPGSAVTRIPMPGAGGTGFRTLINQTEADPAWVAGFNEISDNPTYPARLAVERIRAALDNPGAETHDDTPENPQPPDDPSGELISPFDRASVAHAQLLEKRAKAELAQIDLLQKKGALVSKDAVYKQLFEAGRQLRDSLMAIPSRITAEILSAGDNHLKVQQILTDAIASSLEALDDLNNSDIG